jgi:hypothetical protein
MIRLLATFLLVLWTDAASGQDFVENVSNKGTVAASFLEIGVNPRAEAMGGAYAAEAGRVEMIYWNPAGLAYLDGLSASLNHSEWLASTTFDFVGLATPLPFFNAVLGTGFTTLATPEQPVRTVAQPEGTGEFYDARDFALSVGISARIIPSFSVGVATKYIHQRIWTESGGQVAFDVGVYYQTPFEGLALGSSISNFGGDLQLSGRHLADIIDPDRENQGIENIPVDYQTDAFPLPQLFRFGMAYDTALPGRGALTTTLSLLHPTGSTESMNLGLEYGFADVLFLRAGYQNLFERDAVQGLTLGGGLQYVLRDRSRFTFDYAWADWGVLQQVHRFGVGLTL